MGDHDAMGEHNIVICSLSLSFCQIKIGYFLPNGFFIRWPRKTAREGVLALCRGGPSATLPLGSGDEGVFFREGAS